ncbi:MAG: cytochrome b/b6 domain-containing protein [Ilumatobacteraceae bacterium]
MSAADAPPADVRPASSSPVETPPGRRPADAVVGNRVVRFDRAERCLHWVNATLVLTLIITGSFMYVGALSGIFGRALIETVHLYAGLALPVPFALAFAGRWNRGLRRDAKRISRFLADDWRWLRGRTRRTGTLRVGKFNAGQKLNAILVVGTLPVMFGTGILLQWNDWMSDSWRTGATFVHDWLALALVAVVVGHIGKALAEPLALRAMRTGTVPADHVRRHHPRWWREIEPSEAPPD